MHTTHPLPRRVPLRAGGHRLPDTLRVALHEEPTQSEISALRARALQTVPARPLRAVPSGR